MSTTKYTAEPGTPQAFMEREVDAPAELVFRAMTEPDLLSQWLGPRRLTMKVERFEPRDGGRWRYIHVEPDGTEHGFHGVFHGDPSLDGIVQTFEYEGAPGHVQLDTATFERKGSSTVLKFNSVWQSVEDRDAMMAAGMEEGMEEGFERLDELLAKLVANA